MSGENRLESPWQSLMASLFLAGDVHSAVARAMWSRRETLWEVWDPDFPGGDVPVTVRAHFPEAAVRRFIRQRYSPEQALRRRGRVLVLGQGRLWRMTVSMRIEIDVEEVVAGEDETP